MQVAAKIVEALLEDDDLERLIGDLTDDELDDDGTQRYSLCVRPCVDDGESVTHLEYARLTDPNVQPHFWTVYKRVHEYDAGGNEIEALDNAISDHDTEEEANAEMERLKNFYRAQGRLIEDY